MNSDVYVPIDPIGSLLLRMSLLEGEGGSVDFWCRKARELTSRTRDDFLRKSIRQITPLFAQVMMDGIKQNAAVGDAVGFFTGIMCIFFCFLVTQPRRY